MGIVVSTIHAQELYIYDKYHHDYQLDYFPHFKSYKLDWDANVAVGNDFRTVLEKIVSVCSTNIKSIEKAPGWQLANMGIIPNIWKIITLYIDENGKLIKIHLINYEDSNNLKDCLHLEFSNYDLKPALQNNKPVKCRLSYFIIETNN